MYLLGSLGTFSFGLLLVYTSWPSIVASLPFGVAMTSFLFGVMETKGLQSKLDVILNSTGQKLVVQLGGAIACCALTTGAIYLALERNNPDLELSINKQKSDPTYVYLARKNPVNKNGRDSMIHAGKLKFNDEFEEIQSKNVLDPVLVRIRDECHFETGLCAFSDNIFPVHINNIDKLQLGNSEIVNKVNICRGHSYLQEKTLLISSDPNLIELFKKTKKIPDKTYKVYIGDESNPSICPESKLKPPSPILLFDNEGTKARIPISQFSTYYAVDFGGSGH
jgi:hypothetical protein